jgi:Arc/MetJ-type ribon-helix-helix transcriptional regulator
MNITLPAKLGRFVEASVKDGDYADPSDLVREALRFRIAAGARIASVPTFAALGAISDVDIEAMAFIVLMQAAQSAREDLKVIMAEVKAINAAKAWLRELIRRVYRDATKNACAAKSARLDFSTGLGSERAYHVAQMPVADAESPSGVRLVETDLYPDRIKCVEQIRTILDDLKARLDSMSEMQQMGQRRMQMIMDKWATLFSNLSNIMKKVRRRRTPLRKT